MSNDALDAERDERLRRDYYELGQRRMQVVLLRRALLRFGNHTWCCEDGHCICGFAEAKNIGTDAAVACGVKE